MSKKIVVISLLVVLFLSVFVIIFILSLITNNSTKNPNNTTPTNTPLVSPQISPLQKVSIGKTTDPEIADSLTITKTTTLPNGEIQYEIESQIVTRPEKIITNNGRAIYESVLIPVHSDNAGFTTFSDIKLAHGEPDITLTGSNFYGWYIENRIYSSKGFTVIGNPNTNEVFEIQMYLPMTHSEYLNRYGEDINTNLRPHTEAY